MQFAGKKGFWTLIILGIGLLCFVAWRYVDSFATVTFTFNPTHGNVQLTSTQHGEISVLNNQPLRLKKGEYTLSSFGKNVNPSSDVVQVDGSWQTRKISFFFTREYLAKLYQEEEPAISAVITRDYPTLSDQYSITSEALYGRGDYYGATLVFRDMTSQQRDKLRILLKKKDGEWRVLSKPPVQILSVHDYPSVPRDILVAINQAK